MTELYDAEWALPTRGKKSKKDKMKMTSPTSDKVIVIGRNSLAEELPKEPVLGGTTVDREPVVQLESGLLVCVNDTDRSKLWAGLHTEARVPSTRFLRQLRLWKAHGPGIAEASIHSVQVRIQYSHPAGI